MEDAGNAARKVLDNELHSRWIRKNSIIPKKIRPSVDDGDILITNGDSSVWGTLSSVPVYDTITGIPYNIVITSGVLTIVPV
jgi:hypothetical protein